MAGVGSPKTKRAGPVRKVPASSKRYKPLPGRPLCKYLHRHCFRPRLDGYEYCSSHVLLDKNAPFRQCTYVHPGSHKRCSNAAPKNDRRESFCSCHVKQSQAPKASTSKTVAVSGTVGQFFSLVERYCQDERHDPNYESRDPDKEPIGISQLREQGTSSADPMDIHHLGSSFEKKVCLAEAWVGESDESASEYDDSDRDEPLRHAGVVTYEEAIQTYYNKLLLLQSKYLEEFRYLRYFLLERRRDYLHRLKNEKRIIGHGNSAPGTKKSKKGDKNVEQNLRALQHYHHPLGQEAILHKQYVKKRQAFSSGESSSQPPEKIKCKFSDDDEHCSNDALILSEFCFEHIMNDPKQKLFKYCSGDGGQCKKTIVPYRDDEKCILHAFSEASSSLTCGKFTSPAYSPATPGASGVTADLCDDKDDAEHFQSMDDIASLGLDAVVPGSLFGLNQFGEPGESTDSASDSGSHFLPLRPTEILSQRAHSSSDSE